MRAVSRVSPVLGGALLTLGALIALTTHASATLAVGGDVLPQYPKEAPNPWGISGSMFVGYNGSGSIELNLMDMPGVIHTSVGGYIGYLADASGTAKVDGSSCNLSSLGSLTVGHLGSGELTIENGGTVGNTVGTIGSETDATGTVSITGADSRWDNSSAFYVGKAGRGTLTVATGGFLYNGGVAYFGYYAGGEGDAVVRGTNSGWHAGALRVGYLGDGELTIRDGAHVDDGEGQVAAVAGSTGEVLVTGNDALWENDGDLRVGPGGIGVVTIEDGGKVTVGDQLIIGVSDTLKLRDGGTLRVANFLKPFANGPQHGQFLWEGGRLEVVAAPWALQNPFGVLAPGTSPAIATMTDYRQGPGGMLEIEIGGLAAGTGYDRLAVSDTLDLDGTLRVRLIDVFVPAEGESFDVLNWSKLVGRFDALDLPPLPSTLTWDTSRLYVDGTLGVVPDRDGDGLPDAWEGPGNGVPKVGGGVYTLAGSDPDHKDLFIEIDAMSGRAPLAAALADVIAAFAAVPNGELTPPNPDGAGGVTLHIHMDEASLPLAPWDDEGWPGFDAVKTIHFGSVAEQADLNVVRAKAEAYRYCVFADRLGVTGSSGLGEITGNDFMVTLGGFPTAGGTRNEQAGTFMHELGHTLGLDHGGDDDISFKPNYFSVMNYTWQFPFAEYAGSWELDYSHETLATLDETSLDELVGLPGPPGRRVPVGPPIVRTGMGKLETVGPDVDFNRNGVVVFSVAADVNHVWSVDPPSPGETDLTGFADWPALNYLPSNDPQWNSAGNHARSSSNELDVTLQRAMDKIGDCNGNGVLDDDDILLGTSVDANADGVPDECDQVMAVEGPSPGRLLAVLPNPARGGRTTVFYQVASAGRVEVMLYDASGRRVATLYEGVRSGGSYSAMWNGKDASGREVAAGIYFVTLRMPQLSRTAKVIVVR